MSPMWWMWSGLAVAGELALVTSGATGGIGSGGWHLEIPKDIVGDAAVVEVEPLHGVMAQDRALLIASDGQASTLSLLRTRAPACTRTGEGRLQRRRTEMILVDAAIAPTMAGTIGPDSSPVELWRCRATGSEATLVLPQGGEVPPAWDRFEHRLSLRIEVEIGQQTERLFVVGVPQGDPARRITAIEQALTRRPGALWVDAGSFVDGTSAVRDGGLSLHRPTGFLALRRLAPAALAPGRNELTPGAAAFLAEAGELPYVATNWSAEDAALALPSSRVVQVDTGEGPVSVAFLGIVAPSVSRWVPALAEEGILLTDPVEALTAALEELEDIDLVVVLVQGGPELIQRIQRIGGIDVVVGEQGQRVDRLGAVELSLREGWIEGGPAPITVPLDGVAEVTLVLEGQRLSAARIEPTRITPELEPDQEVLAAINAVRDEVYPRFERPLLQPPGSSPTAVLDDETWTRVACAAVLEAMDAHVALLSSLPSVPVVPGIQTELLVVERLALLDRLVVHRVRGDQLQHLLDTAAQAVPVACGAPFGEKAALVGGRSIDPIRSYRVVTTDRLLANGSVQAVIQLDDRLQGPSPTLRSAVLGVLQGYAGRGRDAVEILSQRSPSDLDPLWLLRMTRASGSVSSFRGVPDPGGLYSEIPETLATSPSSVTVATDLDLALEYSSRVFAWDLRSKLLWSELDVEGEDATEQSDDLRLSTSASLPGADLELGTPWVPYAELLFDSEITPTIADLQLGTRNPRQRDLSLTAGLSSSSGWLTRLRIGALLLKDLSVVDKGLEPGGRLEITTRVPLAPGVSWATSLDGFLFANSRGQDASDLRFKALVDTRLELGVLRWLSAAPYAQVFAFQGRVDQTRDPAVAYTLGASVDLVGALEL